jgi:hypothetical protein
MIGFVVIIATVIIIPREKRRNESANAIASRRCETVPRTEYERRPLLSSVCPFYRKKEEGHVVCLIRPCSHGQRFSCIIDPHRVFRTYFCQCKARSTIMAISKVPEFFQMGVKRQNPIICRLHLDDSYTQRR